MRHGGVGEAAGRQLDRVEVGAPSAVRDNGKGVELDAVDLAEVHVGGVALDHFRPGEDHGDVVGRAHLDDGVGHATLGDRPVQRRVGAADADHGGEHDTGPEAGEESEEQRAAPPSAEVRSGPQNGTAVHPSLAPQDFGRAQPRRSAAGPDGEGKEDRQQRDRQDDEVQRG